MLLMIQNYGIVVVLNDQLNLYLMASVASLFLELRTLLQICFVFANLESFFARAGVNFINMLMRNFYPRRSRKHKKLLDLTVFFVLLGPACVKAARKMLVKLTPGLDPSIFGAGYSLAFKKATNR